MSLGLITLIVLDEKRFTELGRREEESVGGGGDDLAKLISTVISFQKRMMQSYKCLKGDRSPSESEDVAISR